MGRILALSLALSSVLGASERVGCAGICEGRYRDATLQARLEAYDRELFAPEAQRQLCAAQCFPMWEELWQAGGGGGCLERAEDVRIGRLEP